MGYQQFDRRIFVTIGSLESTTGTRLQNLRMTLNLTKTNDRKKNNGTIKIYNLKPDTIETLRKQGTLGVTVEAGYAGHEAVVFIGVVMGMHVEHTGTDNILHIKVIDGVVRAANVWFTKSYAKNIDPWDIMADVVAEMQAANDKLVVGNLSGATTTVYKNGFIWNGLAGDCLTRICADKNLHWFINDNTIHILSPDESVQPSHVPLITPDSGLLGSPQYHEEKTGKRKDKHTEKGIKFKCLLNPDIKVGTEVAVTSRYFDDHYLVKKIVINADSEDSDFVMEVTAINEWL